MRPPCPFVSSFSIPDLILTPRSQYAKSQPDILPRITHHPRHVSATSQAAILSSIDGLVFRPHQSPVSTFWVIVKLERLLHINILAKDAPHCPPATGRHSSAVMALTALPFSLEWPSMFDIRQSRGPAKKPQYILVLPTGPPSLYVKGDITRTRLLPGCNPPLLLCPLRVYPLSSTLELRSIPQITGIDAYFA